MLKTGGSTLRLLFASAAVGISGGFRVFIAFLLAGIAPTAGPCIASALVIYAVYTLDRTIPCAEDRINQGGCSNADRRAGLIACLITYLAGAILFFRDGLFLVPLLPLLSGYMYTKGIIIAGRPLRLKGGLGAKNLVIGLTWGTSIALVVARWCDGFAVPGCILLFFGVKLFVNSTLYDLKDMEGDISAGIRTIPVCLGIEGSRRLLTSVSLLLHLAMALFICEGFIRPESIILGYSGLVGVGFIILYQVEWERQAGGMKRYLRQLLIDGESGLSLALRVFTGVLQGTIVPCSI